MPCGLSKKKKKGTIQSLDVSLGTYRVERSCVVQLPRIVSRGRGERLCQAHTDQFLTLSSEDGDDGDF